MLKISDLELDRIRLDVKKIEAYREEEEASSWCLRVLDDGLVYLFLFTKDLDVVTFARMEKFLKQETIN